MGDVEIEPHADGVGGDEKFDIAILEQIDLGVAGARGERAHDDGGSTALAAQQFSDGVNLGGRKGDDGRATGQARDFSRTGPSELGKARAEGDVGVGQEAADDRLHGLGAQEQGFGAAAGVEQAVGKDVTPVEIGGCLDFVDGEKIGHHVGGHRFDRGHPVAGRLGHYALFAGDQSDSRFAHPLDDAVIDLAGQKAQRQADNARAIGQHALDGIVCFARIGGAEHGLYGLGWN